MSTRVTEEMVYRGMDRDDDEEVSFFKKSRAPSRKTKNFLVHMNLMVPSSLTDTQPDFIMRPAFESSRLGYVSDDDEGIVGDPPFEADEAEESDFDGACTLLSMP